LGRSPLNQLLSKKVMDKWATELTLKAEYRDEAIGQSVCVYRLA
jgi:hypothetical protein